MSPRIAQVPSLGPGGELAVLTIIPLLIPLWPLRLPVLASVVRRVTVWAIVPIFALMDTYICFMLATLWVPIHAPVPEALAAAVAAVATAPRIKN